MRWEAEDHNPFPLRECSPASYFEAAGNLVAAYLNSPAPRDEGAVERAAQIVKAMQADDLAAIPELCVVGGSSLFAGSYSFDGRCFGEASEPVRVLWRAGLVHHLRQCHCGAWLYAVRPNSQTSCSQKCRKARYESSPEGRKKHADDSERWRKKRPALARR